MRGNFIQISQQIASDKKSRASVTVTIITVYEFQWRHCRERKNCSFSLHFWLSENCRKSSRCRKVFVQITKIWELKLPFSIKFVNGKLKILDTHNLLRQKFAVEISLT